MCAPSPCGATVQVRACLAREGPLADAAHLRASISAGDRKDPDVPKAAMDSLPRPSALTGRAQLKTARERAEEKRLEKLEHVQEEVKSGSLVIRQMTDEERERYPPRPPAPNRRGKR
jgi:hypothetical protein